MTQIPGYFFSSVIPDSNSGLLFRDRFPGYFFVFEICFEFSVWEFEFRNPHYIPNNLVKGIWNLESKKKKKNTHTPTVTNSAAQSNNVQSAGTLVLSDCLLEVMSQEDLLTKFKLLNNGHLQRKILSFLPLPPTNYHTWGRQPPELEDFFRSNQTAPHIRQQHLNYEYHRRLFHYNWGTYRQPTIDKYYKSVNSGRPAPKALWGQPRNN